MGDSTEVIRNQMEETRSQLSEKLETLENQVSATVQSTSAAVAETVEAVKNTVEGVTGTIQGTVQGVSEAFNIRLQTYRHPWIVFGGSVAVGCLVAQLLGSSAKKPEEKSPRTEPRPPQPVPRAKTSNGNGKQAVEPVEPPAVVPAKSGSSEAEKESWFGQQLGRLKGLAIGSFLGVVRDMAWRGLPEGVGEKVAEEVDALTSRLGGYPVRIPAVHSEKRSHQEAKEMAEAAQSKDRWCDDGGQG